MKIIIEGVNASGKSYLAKQLSEIFSIPLVHAGPKPRTDEDAIKDCINQIKLKNVIFDRATCVSRIAYGDDNECVEGLNDNHIQLMRAFQDVMISNGCVFIHTTGKGDHLIKDYYTESHIKNIREKNEEIRERYMAIFQDIPHTKYDFRTDSLRDLVRWVKLYMRGIKNVLA